jgi:hypothetical protein
VAAEKSFKVKHGLQVANSATVGGNMFVSEVSEDSHAASLGYLNLLTVEVSETAPSSIFSGKLWLDTTESRLKFYHNDDWVVIATKDDTEQVVDHIHDYAIDGTGRIIEVLG